MKNIKYLSFILVLSSCANSSLHTPFYYHNIKPEIIDISSEDIEFLYHTSQVVFGAEVSVISKNPTCEDKSVIDSFLKSVKGLEISSEREDFTTYHGGIISKYYFGENELTFWDNYLFIESEIKYVGTFYKTPGLPAGDYFKYLNELDYFFLSFTCNQVLIENVNYIDFFKSLHFKQVSSISTGYGNVSLQALAGTIKINIFDDKHFTLNYQPERVYELLDGFSFSSLLN